MTRNTATQDYAHAHALRDDGRCRYCLELYPWDRRECRPSPRLKAPPLAEYCLRGHRRRRFVSGKHAGKLYCPTCNREAQQRLRESKRLAADPVAAVALERRVQRERQRRDKRTAPLVGPTLRSVGLLIGSMQP